MTPHKHYQLKVREPERPLEPNMAGDERPCPQTIECYLRDVSDIKATDIAYWKQVPDYDAYKILLKDGRTFDVSGPELYFWQQTAVD